MFNFVLNHSSGAAGLTAAATLFDDDGESCGSVIFMTEANEYTGYIAILTLANGAYRQDSTFQWLRTNSYARRLRATHSYGLMHQGQCLASWRKER